MGKRAQEIDKEQTETDHEEHQHIDIADDLDETEHEKEKVTQ